MAGLSGFGGLVANPFEVGGNALANMQSQTAALEELGQKALAPYVQALHDNPELWNNRAFRASFEAAGGSYGINVNQLLAPPPNLNAQYPSASSQAAPKQAKPPQQTPPGQPGQPEQPGPHDSVVSGDAAGGQVITSRQMYQRLLSKGHATPGLFSGQTAQSKAYIAQLHQLGQLAGLSPQEVNQDIAQSNQLDQAHQRDRAAVQRGTALGNARSTGNTQAAAPGAPLAGQTSGQTGASSGPPGYTPEQSLEMQEGPLLSFFGVKPTLAPLSVAGLTSDQFRDLSLLDPGPARVSYLISQGVDPNDPAAQALINDQNLVGETPEQQNKDFLSTVRAIETAVSKGQWGVVQTILAGSDPQTRARLESDPGTIAEIEQETNASMKQAQQLGLLRGAQYQHYLQLARNARTLDQWEHIRIAIGLKQYSEMDQIAQDHMITAQAELERAGAALSEAATASGRLTLDQQRAAISLYQSVYSQYRSWVNTVASNSLDPATHAGTSQDSVGTVTAKMKAILDAAQQNLRAHGINVPNMALPGKSIDNKPILTQPAIRAGWTQVIKPTSGKWKGHWMYYNPVTHQLGLPPNSNIPNNPTSPSSSTQQS